MESRKDGDYRSLGEQLRDVAAAGQSGVISQKLIRAATGLNEGIPSEGGFLVQQDFGTDLLRSVFDMSPVANLCWRIPISAGSNGIKLAGYDETRNWTLA